eukprot:3426504-Rhodomonas_salina.5
MSEPYAILGTDLAYGGAGAREGGGGGCSTGIALRARYAMSGTDVGNRSVCLRARHVLSGTEQAYHAGCLRTRYAMSGTDLANGATQYGHLRRANNQNYGVAPR